jgi:uncharacterized protein (DUF2141 family)
VTAAVTLAAIVALCGATPAYAAGVGAKAGATERGASTAARGATPMATLRIVVTGLPSDHGRVHIAVCDSPASWSGKAPSFRGASIPVKNRRAEFVFDDVPFGDYAAKLYDDENGNDRFDVSLIGLPKEAYAFSNGARAYLGQPSFERAKFTVDSPVEVVRIGFD